jgi:hypothetical protein
VDTRIIGVQQRGGEFQRIAHPQAQLDVQLADQRKPQ